MLCKKLLYGIYQPQQLIYEKGQESNRFYVILSGSVQIFMPYQQKVKLEDGAEAIEIIEEEMATLKEGDQFGEVGLIKGTVRYTYSLIPGSSLQPRRALRVSAWRSSLTAS